MPQLNSPLLPLLMWYDKPHIVSVEYLRNHVYIDGALSLGDFVEDVLGRPQLEISNATESAHMASTGRVLLTTTIASAALTVLVATWLRNRLQPAPFARRAHAFVGSRLVSQVTGDIPLEQAQGGCAGAIWHGEEGQSTPRPMEVTLTSYQRRHGPQIAWSFMLLCQD